jgi:hypothetical protein
MNFNPQTNIISTSEEVKNDPSVSEFIKNIQTLQQKWEKNGFSVMVDLESTNDEVWDGCVTQVSLYVGKKVSKEELNMWTKSVEDVYKQKQLKTIEQFRTDNSSATFSKTEAELQKCIQELKKQYNYVLNLKNGNLEDPGVFSARRGYEKVEQTLEKLKAAHMEELNNPSSDESILKRHFNVSLEDYKPRCVDLLMEIVTK